MVFKFFAEIELLIAFVCPSAELIDIFRSSCRWSLHNGDRQRLEDLEHFKER